MPKQRVPKFSSEADEAAWWAAHRDDAGPFVPLSVDEATELRALLPPRHEALAQARAASAGYRARTRPTSIRLPDELVRAAKAAAARRGLPYQTWIKTLIVAAIAADQSKQP